MLEKLKLKKFHGLMVLICVALLALNACGLDSLRQSVDESGKLKVVTTIFPLYDFVRNVGGDKVEVTMLLPPGVEAHAFEPGPSDLLQLNTADVFVYTGEFMEVWVTDLLAGVDNKSLEIVPAARGITLLTEEHSGAVDPHVWLDFDHAQIMVDNIVQALTKKDLNKADYYRENVADYKNELIKLDAEYKSSLANCQSREIVYGGHYAFKYLANRYNLKYSAAQGISPDGEPTARDLIRLIEQIKKDNVQYVFYEELTSPKIAEMLANETKTKMLLLNAAHNLAKEDFENKVSFIAIMESNLKSLAEGLHCN